MEPTFLLLHLFGGAGDTWEPLVAALARHGFDCQTPDLRGHGDNQTHTDFSFAANVADVRTLCETRAPAPVILVGHSMGGKVALAVAAQLPVNVAGLVLIAPSPPKPEPMEDAARARLLAGAGDPVAAATTLEQITVNPLPAPLADRFVRNSVRVNPAAWRDWLEVGSKENIAPGIGTVSAPALVLVGAHDKAITCALMEADVLPHLPGATLHTVPDAAHYLPVEQPEAVADAIVYWLASVLP